MKVTLARHGGLAAAIHLRRPPTVVDTDALPDSAAAELAGLVAAAVPGTAGEEGAGPGRARDAMSYTVTVEEGGRSTELTQSDTTMSPEFAALLSWLEKHSAAQ
ncbi:protealysin inhibitor emfourin [Streptomyces cinerochromogenes]|uniref:protealysin inhibitor emfourin n=1 Tax=Streptomyces cinerochromogenes TaxID=66422 RepID=UPI003697570B